MLIAGLVLMRAALAGVLSEEFAVRLLGIGAVLTGLLRLAGAFRDDQFAENQPRISRRAALGVLELALGIALIFAEHVTRTITIVAGAWGLAGGTILLLGALALRRGSPD